MKILCVAGSRGERAKLAPVVAALEGGHEVAFVHISRSGQVPTWDASASPPEALRLEIGDSTPILRTGAVLRWMEPLLAERGSDLLVTCGASDAALGAALAASLAHVAAAHLDAGVAAVDTAPNAQLLDQTSIFLLAPHLAAVERLAHRGMAHWAYLCGDTLADGPAPVANIVDAAPGPYGLCYLGGPALESPALPAVFDALGRMAMQVLLPAPPRALLFGTASAGAAGECPPHRAARLRDDAGGCGRRHLRNYGQPDFAARILFPRHSRLGPGARGLRGR